MLHPRVCRAFVILGLFSLSACDGGPAATTGGPRPAPGPGPDGGSAPSPDAGKPKREIELGTGFGTVIATGLATPRDLAFNPMRPDELWIVSSDGSATIVRDAPHEKRQAERRLDKARAHFADRPMAIAFGADETNPNTPGAAGVPGTFATCAESRNGGNDFMGPVLWSSDLTTFTLRNGELGSHLDMLHMSPMCTGLAWQGEGNIYWTIAGTTRAIVKYDFHADHGLGNDNHEDGEIWRYATGKIGVMAGVPSGLHYRAEEGRLYIADTGNGRIVKFDPTGATPGPMRCLEMLVTCAEMMGGTLMEVIPPGTLMLPSGLEIFGKTLIVSDTGNSSVRTFDLEGHPIASLELEFPPGSLGGLTVGPDRRVYVTEMKGGQVIRLDP